MVAGVINLKDFRAYGRGISLSIPESAKPGIYARMRAILHAESLIAALIGTVILGLLVQVVEFLCTSGFPALFTRILTLKELDAGGVLRLPAAVHRRVHAGRRRRADHRRGHAVAGTACRRTRAAG